MKYLTHCTTFINALRILIERKVKFGNVRLSNDKYECECLDDFTLYMFCLMNGRAEDIDSLMWLAYCGRTNGASITFCFGDDVPFSNLFSGEIDNFKVEYYDDDLERIEDNPKLIGKIKNIMFERENEYRFLIRKRSQFANGC